MCMHRRLVGYDVRLATHGCRVVNDGRKVDEEVCTAILDAQVGRKDPQRGLEQIDMLRSIAMNNAMQRTHAMVEESRC